MSGTATKGHKQTAETLTAVCDGLRAGLTPRRAAMSAGISESTYFAWRRAGLEQIEAASEDSDAEMSFAVQFALGVEASISEYMLPLIKRVSQAALSGGPGDWRAAAMILQGRFPHEFSERVAVAQSQRIEVSGTIGVDGPFKRRALDKMTVAELDENSEMLHDRIRMALSGPALDAEIEKHERITAELYKQREGERHWKGRGRGCFDTSRQAVDADFEMLKPAGQAREPLKIRAAALHAQAPDKAEGSEVVAEPSATSHVYKDPRPTGFGFNKFGDAINLAEYADEDLSL